jgi:outer membrane protein assembly factor BamB
MVLLLFAFILFVQNKNKYPESVPEKFYDISAIEIVYEFHDWGKIYKEHYTIERIGDNYYYQGKKIDIKIIHGIPDSFTDFYYTEQEKSQKLKAILNFTVSITLKNEKIVLTTTEWGDCFIPWRIEYKGDEYLQYNGYIPSALLNLLIELDDTWSRYDKYITWGCTPCDIPEYYIKASTDFPKSVPVLTPLELKGNSRVLWKTDGTIIGVPVYNDGVVYTITDKGLLAMDSQTGSIIWEYTIEHKEKDNIQGAIQVCGDHVYAAIPPYSVYSINNATGEVLWKTALNTRDHTTLRLIHTQNRLLVYELWGEGLFCLDTTGNIMWSIPHTIEAVTLSHNEVFVEAHDKNRFYYAVVDINTGNILWNKLQHGIIHPVYDNGVLYYSKEGKFIAMDINNHQEIWSYTYVKKVLEHEMPSSHILLGQKIYENNIFLLVPRFEEKEFEVHMVFLNKDGIVTAEYIPETLIKEGSTPGIEIVSDTIYLLIRNGFIEAFNAQNGQKLWVTEIRGPEIRTFQRYKDRLYVSDFERVYCVDSKTGVIEWVFNIRKEFDHTVPVSFVYVSEVNDVIVVGTPSGGCVVRIIDTKFYQDRIW